MQSPRLALFGDRGSEQVERLAQLVVEEGGEPLVFNIQLGGAGGSRLSIREDALHWNGVNFKDVHAVHVRCTAPGTLPVLPPMLNATSHNEWRGQFLREQEYQAATYSFFEALADSGTLVVNRLTSGYPDHNAKGQFYEKLRAWGFETPATLTTNDPAQALAFVESMRQVVVKPAIGIGSTRLFAGADRTRIEEIRVCPVLMQERIRGQVVRVHIVGDTVVLALRILNEYIDSRTATSGFEYYAMPVAEQEKIVAATRRLGLHFAAWDIMVNADGRHVYLDCNPGPYILWIGPDFVTAVLRQLARYLIGYARTGSAGQAAAKIEPWQPR